MSRHWEAFEEFAGRIIDMESVDRVILFGSVARGDHGARSDVDVYIEVTSMEEQHRIEDEAFAVASQFGVAVTPVIVEKGGDTSLTRTVEEEGVAYVRG